MRHLNTMLILCAIIIGSPAGAQVTDCNQLARDLVTKNYNSSSSDYYKLLFLSILTQMDDQTAKESLNHSGKVNVGPISIGPGTWNKDSRKELRSKIEKITDVEQIIRNSASISTSSGDPNVSKSVETCIMSNGGLHLTLNNRGRETAVLTIFWKSFPGSKVSPTIEDVTVVNGNIIGGKSYTKRGAKLEDQIPSRVTIGRLDPKKDLTVVVNTLNGGSGEAYLPPSELPPPPPPAIKREVVKGTLMDVGSGAQYDGYRNPGCQPHEAAACVQPQHGGKLVPSSGGVSVTNKSGRAGFKDPIENSQQYCVTFWASTGACETPVFIQGYATAVEEYIQNQD